MQNSNNMKSPPNGHGKQTNCIPKSINMLTALYFIIFILSDFILVRVYDFVLFQPEFSFKEKFIHSLVVSFNTVINFSPCNTSKNNNDNMILYFDARQPDFSIIYKKNDCNITNIVLKIQRIYIQTG